MKTRSCVGREEEALSREALRKRLDDTLEDGEGAVAFCCSFLSVRG